MQPGGSSKCEEVFGAVRVQFKLLSWLWDHGPLLHPHGSQFLTCQMGIMDVWGLIKRGSVCKALSAAWHREGPLDAIGGGAGQSLNPGAQPPGGGVQIMCPWGLRGGPLPTGHCDSITRPLAPTHRLCPPSPGLAESRALSYGSSLGLDTCG